MNIIIDYRASNKTIDALLKMNLNIIKTPKLACVYDAISGHPDIMIHKLDDCLAVCEPGVYDYFRKNLPEIELKKGSTKLSDKYPGNIAYNTLRIGDKIFCKVKNTDSVILNHYYERGYSVIDIKQGYAKCSVCPVCDNALITSDRGIAKQTEKHSLDVLLIDDSDVMLEGFSNGFFGGATGLIGNKLLVNGNIERHRNCNEIIDFCSGYGVEVVSLSSDKIVDIGSLISF